MNNEELSQSIFFTPLAGRFMSATSLKLPGLSAPAFFN